MDEDDSREQDGGVESLLTALRRAKRELGSAVGYGIDGVQNWIERRWLPFQLVMAGGFSWILSRTFGWLLRRVVELGSRFVSSLVGITLSSLPSTQILLLFFLTYVVHSGAQTKRILVIKTNTSSMDAANRSEIRADGRGGEDFSSRLIAIGGLLAGVIIGWSFGMDGIFVGAGVGWVLGNELDGRLEAKVNEAGRVPRTEEQKRAEKQ